MSGSYLEVTFRHGRALAAYYYLPRETGDRAHHTARRAAGLLIDYTRDGKPIGVEITAPDALSLAAMNRVLSEVGHNPMRRADLEPVLKPERSRQSA